MAGSQMVDSIKSQIKKRQLKPGDSLISTSALARQYGISLVTAHRALQMLAEEEYIVRINGKGTFVADQKQTESFDSLGLTISATSNPWHVDLIEAISAQAMKYEVKLVIGQGEREHEHIDKLASRKIDAMIRYPFLVIEEKDIWKHLQEKKIRTVIINDFWLNGGPFAHVHTDEAEGVKQMIDHLIGLGHKKIAFLDESRKSPRINAYNAYCHSLLLHGISIEEQKVMYMSDYSYLVTQKNFIDDLLKSCTAVFVTYDCYAVPILKILKERGLVPGKDFSVAGFDDIPKAEVWGLTTVRQNKEELVKHAFRILDARQYIPEKISVKPDCIFRTSTGPVKQSSELPEA